MSGWVPLLLLLLLVLLVPSAFAGGYLTGVRRTQHRQPVAPQQSLPAPADPLPDLSAAGLASLVRRTGAELTQIAVQTGVEIGNRAIRDSLGTLSAWALRERPDLHRVTGADGTVTLMFTDIEGSTALNERLGDATWLEVLGAHDKLARRCVRAERGTVIKTQGDSFMVAFAEPSRAVACAIALQRELPELELPADVRLRIRIGVHTGPAIAKGRDLFGINVATAARVAAEARGGEILVTRAVAERLQATELGRARRVTLKGLSGPQHILPVRWSA